MWIKTKTYHVSKEISNRKFLKSMCSQKSLSNLTELELDELHMAHMTHVHAQNTHINFGDLLFQLTDGCLLLHYFISKSRHLLLVGITKLIHLNFQGYSHLICLLFFFCLFLTGYSMNLFWTHIQRISSLVSNVLIITYPAKFLSSEKIYTIDHRYMVLAPSLLQQNSI